mgnify:CR=1 FL=1
MSLLKKKNLKFQTSLSVIALAVSLPNFNALNAADEFTDENTFEEVVVTGSRIKRGNLNTPTPVTVLDSDALKVSGTNNIADLLREVPSVGLSGISSQNSNFNIQNSGLNTINLRNLGEARTLLI